MVDDEFTRSVRPHLPSLRRAALRLTRQPSAADDLVQDTLLRAFRFWDSYRADTQLRAWLLRIQRNAFVSQWRRDQRMRALHQELRAERVEPVELEPSPRLRD